MGGFLGGTSQVSIQTGATTYANIGNPIINFGESSTLSPQFTPTTEQTATLTPKLDNSTTASVGVGVGGGSGSGGAVAKSGDETLPIPATQGLSTPLGMTQNNNMLFYAVGGVGLLGIIYIITKKAK
jgi:hypothetical protein